jgi:hypothetical protein
MKREALAVVEDLDGGRREPDLNGFVHQGMRDRVRVVLDEDVVVEIHFRPFPLSVREGLRRQRAHGRAVESLEEVAATATRSENRSTSSCSSYSTF